MSEFPRAEYIDEAAIAARVLAEFDKEGVSAASPDASGPAQLEAAPSAKEGAPDADTSA